MNCLNYSYLNTFTNRKTILVFLKIISWREKKPILSDQPDFFDQFTLIIASRIVSSQLESLEQFDVPIINIESFGMFGRIRIFNRELGVDCYSYISRFAGFFIVKIVLKFWDRFFTWCYCRISLSTRDKHQTIDPYN